MFHLRNISKTVKQNIAFFETLHLRQIPDLCEDPELRLPATGHDPAIELCLPRIVVTNPEAETDYALGFRAPSASIAVSRATWGAPQIASSFPSRNSGMVPA